MGNDNAPMGGPLSEAERIAEIRARAELFNSADALWLLDKVDQLLTHNGVLVTEVRFQAERADCFRVERDAYKRAKEENDERFQLAAAEAREERDEARALVGVLEGQLATAADPVNGPVQLAIHRATCDESLTHCSEYRGRCVRAAEAASWALGLDGVGFDNT